MIKEELLKEYERERDIVLGVKDEEFYSRCFVINGSLYVEIDDTDDDALTGEEALEELERIYEEELEELNQDEE